jgi:hypothetical protein
MGFDGADCCSTVEPRNILEQRLRKGIVERHRCATMVWYHISARLVYDAKLIWNNMGGRMLGK